jgi:hypothetical protein
LSARSMSPIHELEEPLAGVSVIRPTPTNAWADTEFVNPVKATDCKKLIVTALWTEAVPHLSGPGRRWKAARPIR